MQLAMALKRGLVLLVLVLAILVATAGSAAAQGLTVQGGTISCQSGSPYCNGSPYREAGVNWFDLFQQHIARGDSSYKSGLQALAQHNIRLVRFAASSLPPSVAGEVSFKVWQSKPTRWWSAMDDIFREAEADHVGLIADLNWQVDAFSSLAHQQPSDLASPNSRSAQLMAQYISQFVQRYRSSPALMGYEAGNEFNLYADIGSYPNLTAAQVHQILVETGQDIRAYDPSRMIQSGDSCDRQEAWHLANGQGWVTDSQDQWEQMEEYFNPYGTVTAHPFGLVPDPSGGTYVCDVSELDRIVSLGNKIGEPVIAGEWGDKGAGQSQSEFQTVASGVFSSGAPISMLWTYNTLLIPGFSWSATFTNSLAYELQDVAAQNP